MWTKLFILAACVSMMSAGQVGTVDLSDSTAEFPTNQLEVKSCNAGFDSRSKQPPASCTPFSVTIEIKGIQTKAGGRLTLEIQLSNFGEHTIQLPRSPAPVSGGKQQIFIAFDVWSPPGSLRLIGESIAFADPSSASSTINLGPSESVIYLLPFKKVFQRQGEANDEGKPKIQVELHTYLLKKGPARSDDVSVQQGNPILSRPFTLPD